ncbi:MAG: hypothetical protein ACK5HA_09310 [Planctomycetaceae bacterium]|jgi:hypothetical protein
MHPPRIPASLWCGLALLLTLVVCCGGCRQLNHWDGPGYMNDPVVE